MNNEIKEILDKLNKLEYDDIHLIICEVISRREIKKILDCITNLQEENQALKQAVKDTYESSQDMLFELQSRIDKAIEYITNNYDFYYGDELYDSYKKIINILQGEDN